MHDGVLPADQVLTGLTSDEARKRLLQFGRNAVEEEKSHPFVRLLGKFWAPVPWMLELTILLELVLKKHAEAIIIGGLLVFNAALGFFQEHRAEQALEMLRRRLSVQARVLRDRKWQLVPAENLVPGDIIHLRMGDMVPADAKLFKGQILLDQAALTGESAPVEAGAGGTVFAGTVVKRGEASGEVVATGSRTSFGKTADLVRTARTAGHLQKVIFTIVKDLIFVDGFLVVAVLAYGLATRLAWADILPFALMLMVASVPVALPATFTLASALGTQELAQQGVLVSRLSAIEEAAAMDVLASDKTGTITRNELSLADLRSYPPSTGDEVLRLAALASEDATQDPIDLAILNAARARSLNLGADRRLQFIPFDPSTKRSEALITSGSRRLRVAKGAPSVIFELAEASPEVSRDAEALARQGYRVLAVACGADALRVAGLLALLDPPRPDSETLIQALVELGLRVLMVTGDGPATAETVAAQVGIRGRVCPPERLRNDPNRAVEECNLFAGVLPEDKFRLVQALQQHGHTVGMTGDGVNDAPALKQAEVGIAVANATDVAKAAASVVLTKPGLTDIVAAVKVSRRIYQRMLTYTLNKIIKTIEIALFLSLGLMLTHTFVVTPLLIVLLLFTNDFVTMSIASDRVSFSSKPDHWDIQALILTALPLAGLMVLLSFGIFLAAKDLLHIPLGQLQTLMFAMLVFSGQGTVYLVRERRHFWHSAPGKWLLLSSLGDIAVVSLFASQGILMTPVRLPWVAAVLGVISGYLVGVDFLKIRIFQHFGLHQTGS
jgi:H+-transporting ATPase